MVRAPLVAAQAGRSSSGMTSNKLMIALGVCLASRAKKRGCPLALLPEERQARVKSRAEAGARRAAVFVPIASVEGQPSIVLTVRSMIVSQPGQVSFPGGHLEPGEIPIQAAFREAEEELGTEFRRDFQFVDECYDVLAPSGVVVTPIIAIRSQELCLEHLQLSDEVSQVFSLPISHLLNDNHREWRSYEGRGRMPVFFGGPEEVWGLTAYILDGILEAAIAPCWQQLQDQDDLADEISTTLLQKEDAPSFPAFSSQLPPSQ